MFVLTIFALLCISGQAKYILFDEAAQRIQDSLKLDEVSLDNPTCTLSDTETCDLSTFTKDSTSLIYPGGSTRCIFSDSTDYAIQIIPGATDKLLFYFQAGGACWDRVTTTILPLCTTDAAPYNLVGVFNRTNTKNLFKDYTVVIALYCSGDVFGGNVTQRYDDSQGVPVSQQGTV